jgi:hypothetical protein
MIVASTPDGRVYISFNAVEAIPLGTPSRTTGFGQMVRTDGNPRPSWCAYVSNGPAGHRLGPP